MTKKEARRYRKIIRQAVKAFRKAVLPYCEMCETRRRVASGLLIH